MNFHEKTWHIKNEFDSRSAKYAGSNGPSRPITATWS